MTGSGSVRAHSSESVADAIRAIVSRTGGRRLVSDQFDLVRDLHLGDTGRTELLMGVEIASHIDFSAEEAAAISTVRDLIASVEKKLLSVEDAVGARGPLLEAIKDLAAGAANAGETIDIVAAANALVASYPQTGLTVDDICEEIEQAAVAAGATTLPNGRRHSA